VHLLYLTQYYVTEDQPGSIRHHQHAQHLIRHGHRVTVVSAFITHAQRAIPREYAGRRICVEEQGCLTIYRTYASPGYKRDVVSRLKNYLTFMFYAFIAGLRVRDVDAVLASINPISVGLVGWLMSVLKRVPFVLEVCDLSADSAEALQVVRSKWFIRLVRWVEAFLFRRSARVIALTQGIGNAVEKAGVSRERIAFVPMGVDLDLLRDAETVPGMIRQSEEEFIAVYVGSYTTYPGLDQVLLAAERLKHYPDIRFVFVGGGDQREHMESMVRQLDLSNVTIHGVRPKREVGAILSEANVCILPYGDVDLFRGALPNKLFDYLASGGPVIAAVRRGEVTAIIEESGAGLCVAAEQPAELADAVLWAYNHPQEAQQMGVRGREYVVQHFDRRKIMDGYLELLEEVTAQ
jgi:colanic acid biosynthesis glycosyl transferase WcaI